MEEMDGLEAARWLRENGSKACIVFLTGYPEYSLEGYKVDAHRYLLKNAENIKEALNECLSSALEKLERSDIISRIGPTLGLMGTLIPMGPGLAALGTGDINILVQSLTVAFDTTIVGIGSGPAC